MQAIILSTYRGPFKEVVSKKKISSDQVGELGLGFLSGERSSTYEYAAIDEESSGAGS